MKVIRIQLCIGLFCSCLLFTGCYGSETKTTPDSKPVVQDMQIEPSEGDQIPMQ